MKTKKELMAELKLEREQHKKALRTIEQMSNDLRKLELEKEKMLVKLDGKEQTISIIYNLMRDFVANGIIVHNSGKTNSGQYAFPMLCIHAIEEDKPNSVDVEAILKKVISDQQFNQQVFKNPLEVSAIALVKDRCYEAIRMTAKFYESKAKLKKEKE